MSAAVPSTEDAVLSIDIATTPEKVWEEITKTGRIQKAFYNTVLESTLQPGAKLRYYSPDKKRVFVVGEVLEVDAPNRLKHTYMMTMTPEGPTVVTWELVAIESGCRVTITHSGWTEDMKTRKNTAVGWTDILSLLKAEIETGQIPLKTRLIYAIQGAMMFMLPKSTKVEEVDRQGW